ncbi:helix-turn-helix domain-containing protein [Pseudoroseicyclus aestuarii]|uniref:Transcriptional regulator with XRE-family HTH domain n=1 Tax=Pseudoroseicyclus aestuarii TaxID=1795041 RepID=A0A318SN87_9RHOB|nr:helix-turn-helix transcriptional regulator [Pseudoroseicyclus aestuarii]PYE81423.1 transcriptional regulator with XRE-family HTH domain [Pseudoroseicyclus aestuarii]
MFSFVAHSEFIRNGFVRDLRRASQSEVVYHRPMRLKIKEMRQERGWTVDVLADKVGMSRSYVSEIENGKKTVNNLRLSKFAEAFGVWPADLIDDGSVDPDIVEHIKLMRRLSPSDREAVLRHALALDRGERPD